MQVQFNDIAGGECALRKVGEEQFIHDACTRHANGTLLFPGRMRCHDHATAHAIGSHRYLWAVVEAANHLTLQSAAETDRKAGAGVPLPSG